MKPTDGQECDLGTATPEEINRTMARGVSQALQEHRCAGRSIVVWDREHDHAVIIPPEQIVLPDEDQAEMVASPAGDTTSS